MHFVSLRFSSSLKGMDSMHDDDQDGREHSVNSRGKRERGFESTEQATRPTKTRKRPSNNAHLLPRGANETELGENIRPKSESASLPQVVRNELCDACREIELSRFNIEKHVSGTGQGHDQNEPAWVHTIDSGNPDCSMCRLVVNAIKLFSRDPAMVLPAQVILTFSVFGRTTERHPFGGETSYTTRRICIFSQKSDNEYYGNGDNFTSQLCLIGLIQCHHPPLSKRADKWEFEHSVHTVQSLFSGRAIDSLQVNFEQLRSWINPYIPDSQVSQRVYETEMSAYLRSLQKGSLMARPLNMRAIDISRGIIRDAPFGCNYAALSYVWGQLPQLRLTKSTYKQLTKKGGLSRDCANLSPCVKDAMTLCEKLGINFLWVDALCIKQDDPNDRKIYIENMGTIYSRAVLTIVAAAGKDTSTGLPGVRANTRKMIQTIETVGGYKLSPTISYNQAVDNSVWATRGWTLQERELSHELLIFTDYQVFFQSRKRAYREDTFLEMSRKDVTTSFVIEGDLFLDIAYEEGGYGEYAQLVSKYTRRTLSYSSDLSNAFRGIVQSFGKLIERTPNSFFFALPTTGLDFALCWDQTPNHSVLHARVREFPSWSWLGWIGEKQYSENVARPGAVLRPGLEPPYYDKSPLIFYDHISREIGALSNGYFDLGPQPPWKPRCAPPLPPPPYAVIPRQHMLRFWTSSTKLSVRKHSSIGANYMIFNPKGACGEKSLGRILLDPDWIAQQPSQELQFIIIASQYRSFVEPRQYEVHTLCVEYSDELRVSYRVNKNLDPISVEDWMATGPVWKAFALA